MCSCESGAFKRPTALDEQERQGVATPAVRAFYPSPRSLGRKLLGNGGASRHKRVAVLGKRCPRSRRIPIAAEQPGIRVVPRVFFYDHVRGTTSGRPLVMIGGRIFHSGSPSPFLIPTRQRQRNRNYRINPSKTAP